MKPEKQFLIDVLADYIHGRTTKLRKASLDWKMLVNLANDQGVSAIVWYQCRELLNQQPAILELLHAAFTSTVFYDVCREKDLEEITAEYTKASIGFLPMKGMILASYHPIPQLRSMGDIDLVIHSEDRKAVDEIMLQMGFKKTVDNHAVWTYSRDVVIYEIHDHMMYEPLANQIDYRGYFDRVWEYAKKDTDSSRYDVQPEFHFLYLIAHTAKHIVNKGSGLRPFLDIVFMVQKVGKNMDWDWIRKELEQLQLLDFTLTCFALCEKWFDVKMPLPSRQLSERFYQEATQKALQDGLFGLENERNQTGASAKAIRRSTKPYWITVMAITVKKLFPPYRDMQLIPWYSFVDGRPYLLPLAWIYRWGYCLMHKFGYGMNLLREPFTERQKIEEREEFINDWML